MPIIVVCNVFQERLAIYGKCLLSSFVICSRALCILREMPIIVVCNVFQERMASYGKCLLSSFVMCFKSVRHLMGNAYYRRL